MDVSAGPTLSERFEKSFVGEVLISALVTAALIIALVWNLPDSEIKRSAKPALEPLATSSGLEQVWQMYAPDPVRRLEILEELKVQTAVHATLLTQLKGVLGVAAPLDEPEAPPATPALATNAAQQFLVPRALPKFRYGTYPIQVPQD